MTGKQGTALGVARARFVDGLPRKANELKASLALLATSPDATAPREELRRRLHALYASAQVFRIEALATALKENIQALDASREAKRPVSQEEIDNLAHLSSTLPLLGGRPSNVPYSSPSGPPAAPVGSTPGAPAFPPPVAGAPAAEEGSAAKRLRSRRSTAKGIQAAPPPEIPKPAPVPRAVSSVPPRRPSFTAATRKSGRPSTMPGAPLEMIISVLVVDDVATQTKIRDVLPKDRYELLAASDPEEALRLARSSAPDIVLVGQRAALGDADFVARLRSDPLTDFVPVVLLHAEGEPVAADVLRDRGIDAAYDRSELERLARRVDRIVGGMEMGPTGDVVGDATLEEVADRLAQEIHRGIVEAAAAGRDMKIALGDGSELLAAAWATIARVRAELAERSGGQIRFRDGAARGGPAFMSLVDEGIAQASATEEVSLEGRRVIVADDDPAVVWFFAGLLREEGALVAEVEDGLQALEAARKRRPDVILSDILMPRMDGLALTRELKRDPALAEVPVILLSWKEDFLQRMRELQAGASGYLRKEAAAAQIIHKVREVLRPRARLEAQLRAGGEVRGRIEGLGVLPLLTTIGASRPEARVTVRDAWNLFEIDFREGDLVDVTRTATDGSFSRGDRALPQLLGMSAGRFTVGDADGPVRESVSEALQDSLDEAVQRLGAFVDAVSGARLAKVATLKFDDDLVDAFVRTSPGEARELVERIRDGEKPRDLLMSGEVAPQALETALVDLARRGAILEVRDEDRGDLVAGALEARLGSRADGGLDWLESEESTGDIVAITKTPPEEKKKPFEQQPLGLLEEPTQEVEVSDLEEVSSETHIRLQMEDEEREEAEELLKAPTNPPPRPSDPPPALGLDEPLHDVPSSQPPPADEGADTIQDEPIHDLLEQDAKKKEAKKKPEPEPEEPQAEEEEKPKAKAKPKPKAPSTSTPPRPQPQDEPSSLGFAFAILLALAVGFVAWKILAPGPEPEPEPEPVVQNDPEPDEPERPEQPEEPEQSAEPERDHTLSFGQDIPRLMDTNVDVGEGQGVLMVQAASDGSEVNLEIRPVGADEGRDIGTAPVGVALDEGQYEIVFRGGGGERVRYAFVRSGHTRVVRPD